MIGRDSITGLLGLNGAGKTTLMQLLPGHRLPTSGSVEVLGGVPHENESVLSRVCFVTEGQRYPDHFRVRDALDAAALVYPDWTPTSPPTCCGTSTSPSSGRSRSSPAA